MGAKAKQLQGLATAVSLKLRCSFGDVYRVSVLWVVSQGPVTHAHAHKQGFGPLEKITLIITGCIWTCPQREGEGGREGGKRRRRRGLTEKEKERERERERATSAGAFLHAVSYWRWVSPSVCAERFPRGGEGKRATDAALGAVDTDI